MPDNKSSLELLRGYNFYELYWIMTTKIFGRYGQGSLRAEAEIAKMLMISLYYTDGTIRDDDSFASFYQFGKKKLFIVLNEMARTKGEENPSCRATGHDRHVKKFSTFFNPYEKFDDVFTRILCQNAEDWILWSFNEIVGELQQCLRAKKDTAKSNFAISVLGDLFDNHPQYKGIVMALVKKWQWDRIRTTGSKHNWQVKQI